MAHVKAGGRARQGTPRRGRRLGIKVSSGRPVKVGSIIVRQRGSTFLPGIGVRVGRDYTLFALKGGQVNFKTLKGRKIVEVV
ncbi:MAG TPA: 50S ribosomal protein L27 [Patescibacteria group bacterium]|nr:50S ribosomal protein L27 [Patescibacteria group bacterium]